MFCKLWQGYDIGPKKWSNYYKSTEMVENELSDNSKIFQIVKMIKRGP